MRRKQPSNTLKEIAEEEDRLFDAGQEMAGTTPIKAAVSPELDHIASIRFSSIQARRIEAAAEHQGLQFSEFVRTAVDAALDGDLNLRQRAAVSRLRKQVRELASTVKALEP